MISIQSKRSSDFLVIDEYVPTFLKFTPPLSPKKAKIKKKGKKSVKRGKSEVNISREVEGKKNCNTFGRVGITV